MHLLTKILFTISLILTSCVTVRLPQNTSDYAKTSAMLTLEGQRAGGSGVILKSTPNRSYVLTNKHICQLIQVGGMVTTDQGSYPVHSFRVYKRHDLCLVEVLADLHQNNKLAEHAPKSYQDVIVAGHPNLLPTIITRGHFADHITIQLIVDKQACAGDEQDQEAFFCQLMGFKPVFLSYEAQPISATIMPGSSGSGVFNEKGEISGLVFAGNEGLNYGYIVPYEYVKDFLNHARQYTEQFPDKKSDEHFFISLFKMQDVCKTHPQDCKGFVFQGIAH